MISLLRKIIYPFNPKWLFIIKTSEKTLFYPKWIWGSAFIIDSQEQKDQIYTLLGACNVLSLILFLIFSIYAFIEYDLLPFLLTFSLASTFSTVFPFIVFSSLFCWKIKKITKKAEKLDRPEGLKKLAEHYKTSLLIGWFSMFFTFGVLVFFLVFQFNQILISPEFVRFISPLVEKMEFISLTSSEGLVRQICSLVLHGRKIEECSYVLSLNIGISLLTIMLNILLLFLVIGNVFLGYMTFIKFRNKYKQKTNISLKQIYIEIQKSIMTVFSNRMNPKRFFVTTTSQKILWYPYSIYSMWFMWGSVFVVNSQEQKDQISKLIRRDLIFCHIISLVFSFLCSIVLFVFIEDYFSKFLIFIFIFLFIFQTSFILKIGHSARQIKGLQKLNRLEVSKNLTSHYELYDLIAGFWGIFFLLIFFLKPFGIIMEGAVFRIAEIVKKIDMTSSSSLISQVCTSVTADIEFDCLIGIMAIIVASSIFILLVLMSIYFALNGVYFGYMVVLKLQNKHKKG